MNDRFLKICEYVNLRSPWADDTTSEVIWEKAQLAKNEICKGKEKGKRLIRICGQTGSGKTSQVLWAVEEFNKLKGKNPVTLAVRCFAEYHPKYEEFLKEFERGEIREKTNGFALKCLAGVLYFLVKDGYSIVFDMTLLAPEFEEYVLDLLSENNYEVTYHILAVNTKISEKFLKERLKDSGRIVYSTSVEYFNNILNEGFSYICENDKQNLCYIWTAFDKDYVYKGLVKDAFKPFIENQKRIEDVKFDKEELKKEKLRALLK